MVREELEAVRLLARTGHAGLELESELALQHFALDPTDPTARETIRQLLAAGVLTPQQRGDLTRSVEREAANIGTGESLLKTAVKTSAAPAPVDLEEYFADPAESEPTTRPPVFSGRFWLALAVSVFVLLLFAGLLRTDRTPALQRALFGTPAAVETATPGLERRAPRRNLVAEEVYRSSGAQDAHDAALRALELEDYATAESRFRAAIRLQNFQPSEAELNLLRLYYNRGRDYFNAYQGRLEQRTLLDTASRYFQLGIGLPAALRDSLQRRGLARLFSDSLRWAPIQEYNRHGLGLSYFFAGDTALAEAMYLTLPRPFFDTLSFSPNLQTFVAGEEETSRLLGVSPQEIEGNVTELVVNYYLQTNSAAAATFVEAIVTNDTSVRAVQLPSTLVNGSAGIETGLGSATLRLEPRREYPEQADSILVLLRQGDTDVLDRRWLAYPKDWTALTELIYEPYDLSVRDAYSQQLVNNVQLTIEEELSDGRRQQVYRTYVRGGERTLLPEPLRENMRFTFRHEGYATRPLNYGAFLRVLRSERGRLFLTPTRSYLRNQIQRLLAKNNYGDALQLMIAWARENNTSRVGDLERLWEEWRVSSQERDKGLLTNLAWQTRQRVVEVRVRALVGELAGSGSTEEEPIEKVELEPTKTTPEPSAQQRDIPQQQQQIQLPIDPKQQTVVRRVGRSRLVGNNDPVAITDFGGASSGKYLVELEFFTNVYNSTAKMRAVIDLDENIIRVQSYSHFQSKSADDSVNGDGTARITTGSEAYSRFRVYLSYGTLFLEQVSNPAGEEGQLRLEGATWQQQTERQYLQPSRTGKIRINKRG